MDLGILQRLIIIESYNDKAKVIFISRAHREKT